MYVVCHKTRLFGVCDRYYVKSETGIVPFLLLPTAPTPLLDGLVPRISALGRNAVL
jgi:hypothetical protein